MIYYLGDLKIYNQMIESNKNTFVVFSSKTCGPCIMLEPIISEFANDKNMDLIFVELKDFTDLAQQHSVSATPTVFLYNSSKILTSFVGYKTYEELGEIIENSNK